MQQSIYNSGRKTLDLSLIITLIKEPFLSETMQINWLIHGFIFKWTLQKFWPVDVRPLLCLVIEKNGCIMLPFEFNLGPQHNLNCTFRQWATLISMAWITKIMKNWQVFLQYILCQSTWDPGYLASIAICSTGSSKVFLPVVPKINTSCGVSRY